LIPSEFQNVKLLKSQGKHSKEIAEQLDLSMREVNIAMSASDYTHYLDIRESQ
jgi:DNA-binding NarL/FixJ family response regulator